MKEQINKYAKGKFEYNALSTQVNPADISCTVYKNVPYTGRIDIWERYNRVIKGLVYSSNNKVILKNHQFVGEKNTIEYTIDMENIDTETHIVGAFYVVSNGGEEKINYDFSLEAGSFESELGMIKNLFHLTNLAQKDFDAAVKIFTMPEFNQVFIKNDLSLQKYHDELLLGSDEKTALEEFFIGVHKKSRVNISIEADKVDLEYPVENEKLSMKIAKDIWGRIEIYVSTDCDFISVPQKYITEEDFIGGNCDFVYIINKDKLHDGKNIGRIFFETPYQTLKLEIFIHKAVDSDIKEKLLFEKKNLVKLFNTYTDYRLHKINLASWIDLSKLILDKLIKYDEENPFYLLAMAQVLVAERRPDDAKIYIDLARDMVSGFRKEEPVIYSYFLYVNALHKKDIEYARETAEIVKEIYEKECKSDKILWILLYLDVEMAKNKSLKLLRIKEQYNNGMRSPMLYAEACMILNEQPMLLRVLNDFELSVLLSGCKKGVVEPMLARQATEVAVKSETKPELLCKLLMQLYERFPDTSLLEAICSIMIKNGYIGSKYKEWYRHGIEKGIRITKLYEYYLMSREQADDSPLPKMVLLYFGYNTELPFEWKSYLYRNVIKYKDDNPQIFHNYENQIRDFVKETISFGRADLHTSDIFSNYLKKDMINPQNVKNAFNSIVTCVVTCENKRIKNVYVGHKEKTTYDKYPLINGMAFVRVYTDNPTICFEDAYGRIYGEGMDYSVKKLYKNDELIKYISDFYEYSDNLAISTCERRSTYIDNSMENIKLYKHTIKLKDITHSYRQELIEKIIDYYFDSFESDETEKFLDDFDMSDLSEGCIVKYVETLIVHGKYEKAFRLGKNVRLDRFNPKRILKMCDYLLDEKGYEKYSISNMLDYTIYAFIRGKYSDNTLEFLVKNYNGSTPLMTEIWKYAVEENVDANEIEERCICQMLFSGYISDKMSEVFRRYYGNNPKSMIVDSYLAYNSYCYFVKEMLIPDNCFDIIEEKISSGREVILVSRFALLKYYSELTRLGDKQIELAKTLIEELCRKGYIFSFYSHFSEYFKLPVAIADKTIIEHRANPNNRVVLHYQLQDDNDKNFISVDMKNIYEGIFVKTFVIFYGKDIEYYITEEDSMTENAVASSRNVNETLNINKPEGRYERINTMLACRELNDMKTLEKDMHQYKVLNCVCEHFFSEIKSTR